MNHYEADELARKLFGPTARAVRSKTGAQWAPSKKPALCCIRIFFIKPEKKQGPCFPFDFNEIAAAATWEEAFEMATGIPYKKANK